MELDENNAQSSENEVGEQSPKKKRKNAFNANRKEDKEKRRLRRARIIIRNISYKTTDELLRKHFEQFGAIVELNLLKRADGKLVGCAFIQYEKVNEAAKAILKANNKEFLGRPVYVDWALGKDEFVKKQEEKDDEDEDEDEDLKKDDEDIKIESNEEDNDNNDIDNDESESDGESEKKRIKLEPGAEKKSKRITNDVKEGCTVFIKNVPFDATSDDLRKCCRKFGPIYYALINSDSVSGHSKGTGFVKFKTKESADLCLKAGDEFVLFDTMMEPHPALSKDDVRNNLNSAKNKEPLDSRNLYLVKEGLIMTGSKAADGVSVSDMAKRHKLEQMKTQILKNLNRFVSKNRLSIHNLPLNYDDEKLRKLIIQETNFKPHECRVMRENKPSAEYPKGKPKGFGFMSFKTHLEALTALRKLNNNPTVFNAQNRPIVAFSIEDRSVHSIKEKRLQRSKEHNPTFKEKLEKLKGNKKNKKQKQKDDKNQVQKKIHQTKSSAQNTGSKKKEENANDLDEFAGMPAQPGTFIRMRSNRKINAQSQEHSKKLGDIKRKEKRRRENKMLRLEKRQIDRTKQNKKIPERDNFTHLVDKYKRLIDSTNNSESKSKSKRSKWYVE